MTAAPASDSHPSTRLSNTGISSRDDATCAPAALSNRRLALAVSEVVGVRKIVVRPLDGLPSANGLYLGGAMMGDGAVALIINPDALMGMEVANAK